MSGRSATEPRLGWQTKPLHSWEIYDERAVLAETTTATALLTDRPDINNAYLTLFTELEYLAGYDDDARQLLSPVASRYREMTPDGS
ncbi:MAG: hypothetical protein M3Z25_06685 [Actinomycetota bacterium]|nr:hypothetical protein [Actinomycetota bacterium]